MILHRKKIIETCFRAMVAIDKAQIKPLGGYIGAKCIGLT